MMMAPKMRIIPLPQPETAQKGHNRSDIGSQRNSAKLGPNRTRYEGLRVPDVEGSEASGRKLPVVSKVPKKRGDGVRDA